MVDEAADLAERLKKIFKFELEGTKIPERFMLPEVIALLEVAPAIPRQGDEVVRSNMESNKRVGGNPRALKSEITLTDDIRGNVLVEQVHNSLTGNSTGETTYITGEINLESGDRLVVRDKVGPTPKMVDRTQAKNTREIVLVNSDEQHTRPKLEIGFSERSVVVGFAVTSEESVRTQTPLAETIGATIESGQAL